MAALLLPLHAAAAQAEPLPVPSHEAAILALLAGGVVLSLGLAGLALRQRRQVAPAPIIGVSPEELQQMRQSISAFANLLRDGSAALMRSNTETLESANQLAAHSQQLIALLAGAEARVTNATQRSEILATRVAKSAAVEIKDAVKNLTEVSARIEATALIAASR